MNSGLRIPLAIVVGGIIIAVAVYVAIPKTASNTASLLRPVSASEHILGNPAAKVLIVQYSDFDCEFCKGFHETLKQIIATAGVNGDVALVFRHFPLTELHPNALSHARAAECVAEVSGNDAFWRFVDLLFKNQPADPSTYGSLAASSGISGDSFAACYASASTNLDTKIMADRQNALDLGAQGTPYSLVITAGKPPVVVDGAYSYDDLKLLVDQALGN